MPCQGGNDFISSLFNSLQFLTCLFMSIHTMYITDMLTLMTILAVTLSCLPHASCLRASGPD
jgi:hypothetical protein